MKARIRKLIYLLASTTLTFITFISIQMNFNQEKGSIYLDTNISASIQNADAQWEIYCWSCEGADICGHVEGFVCCWDSNGGWNPCG